MKRNVTITMQIDAEEYQDVADTEHATIDLVMEMFAGLADWPNEANVICGDILAHGHPGDEDWVEVAPPMPSLSQNKSS